MTKTHPSVSDLSSRYYEAKKLPVRQMPATHFCDNEKDANECARLVSQGEKRATATSRWWFEANNQELPRVGDCFIVTDWGGIAVCVVEIEKIEVIPFNKVTSEFAAIEGEGDKSLRYWKKVHWDYYHRESADSTFEPSVDMLIVCEYFCVVFR